MPNRREAGLESGLHLLPAGLDGLPWELPRVFLGLDGPAAAPEAAAHWILPVPFEATTSWGAGARFGPRALIDASRYIELFDHELGRDPSTGGVYTFPALELVRGDARGAMAELEAAFHHILAAAAGRGVIMLGGEHSVSAPAIAAHAVHGSPAFRAPPAFPSFSSTPTSTCAPRTTAATHSHACAMRHAAEHADIVCVGARGISREEWEFAAAAGHITVVTAEEIAAGGPGPGPAAEADHRLAPGAAQPDDDAPGRDAASRHWSDRVLDALGPHVYITFDVDFLDPSLMPATGTPEPGGGDWTTALALLRRVFAEREVVGADVVELAPVPGLTAPDFVAARLVYKMIGYWTHEACRPAGIPAQQASSPSDPRPD